MGKIWKALSSLWLTVILLTLAGVLVFMGTMAQVKLGLYIVQENYFQSLFVMWGPQGANWKIPIWPGGYLLGGLLLVNLITAHVIRFKFTKKKIGIIMVHGGLIFLLIGQFLTEVYQVESFMALEEGSSKNYSENGRRSEVAIIDVTDPQTDHVVAIPESMLEPGREIRHPQLPFTVKIHEYALNTEPRLYGSELRFISTNQAVKMNDRNIPAATVEIKAEDGSKGTWKISNWLAEDRLVGLLLTNYSSRLPQGFSEPVQFEHKGRRYEMSMRPERYYKPFQLHLLDFTHERYAGTDTPKNFSSRVRLVRPETNEDREILIYMNNPLRYWGETYYQGGFEPGDTVSILQVVRNPSWLTPYISCVLVGVGLLVQFLSHLVAFAKKRSV
ncbi:MAG: cytochrome c biogenesis protein ResB [Verrucomicrobiota bacterium]|nr:cytochrome c biogenesis protein ResB [Verrucomicrobiota bacterium]